jgi:hypothetical protein
MYRMRCQYSRCGEASSEKHGMAADPGAEEKSWLMRVVTVTVVGGGYRLLPESLTALIRMANSTKVWRFRTCGRLYVYDTILERLAQHLQDMAAELRQLIQNSTPLCASDTSPGIGT